MAAELLGQITNRKKIDCVQGDAANHVHELYYRQDSIPTVRPSKGKKPFRRVAFNLCNDVVNASRQLSYVLRHRWKRAWV